ncbi:uncharacterized protein LOC132601940 [Lycium barbarum]|uniref:uncharacterized protein LOC132601940 n=1 Tax=Lycium barbarum TaxID=112863 RepID=UPI00293E207D|nr:uncharacterized protein LOC132601940 [Lycium barbarum]
MARSYLDKATRKMKKVADRKRRPTNYRIGDKVMVKLNPRQFKSLKSLNQSLIRRYEGPFEIIAKVGKIYYRLDMPHHLKIYPVFHASQLKPYFDDKKDEGRAQASRARIFETPTAKDKEIEAIIDHQLVRGKGWGNSRAQFLVHWKGQPPEEATWEAYEDLWKFKDKVHEFLQLCGAAVVAKTVEGKCAAPPPLAQDSLQLAPGASQNQHAKGSTIVGGQLARQEWETSRSHVCTKVGG